MKCIKRSWLNTIAAILPNIHDIFTVLRLWYNHSTGEKAMSKNHVEELRKKYIQNPPEGLTPDDIKDMPDDALLDMDYFLNEEDFDDEIGAEGFYIF